LDALVKQMLTLSKTEEETDRQTYAAFDLGELVRELAAAFRPMADSHGKAIVCDAPHGLMFCGNEDDILRLTTILLDNAVKYAAPGGSIRVKLSGYGKRVVLEMRNPLSEPPVDDPDRLFDRFFRPDCARSRESGGYGIGLAIARAVARAHKGDIAAAYENDGQIICFRVQLASRRKTQNPPHGEKTSQIK
jgi:signal transduction histidine kinase